MQTAKQELNKYVKTISEEDAELILPIIRKLAWLSIQNSGDPLTKDEVLAFEEGTKELLKGEYITLNELQKQ